MLHYPRENRADFFLDGLPGAIRDAFPEWLDYAANLEEECIKQNEKAPLAVLETCYAIHLVCDIVQKCIQVDKHAHELKIYESEVARLLQEQIFLERQCSLIKYLVPEGPWKDVSAVFYGVEM